MYTCLCKNASNILYTLMVVAAAVVVIVVVVILHALERKCGDDCDNFTRVGLVLPGEDRHYFIAACTAHNVSADGCVSNRKDVRTYV